MSRAKTPSFVTELPLRVTSAQEREILIRLEFARQLYNACLGELLKRATLMRESREYQTARQIPKDKLHKKERGKAFRQLREKFGVQEYAIHDYEKLVMNADVGKIDRIGSTVGQTVATRAYNAVNRYLLGKSGRPRFKGRGQFDSVEGKGDAVIRWKADTKTVEWNRLVLPAILPRKPDAVIEHGLQARVKYVRLVVRRKINGKNRFYVQLVCEGLPFRKEKHPIGSGRVGLDIGPSTIAIVAPDAQRAELRKFCAELKPSQREIRRLQRKFDRQRRANNPQNYNPDGTIRAGKKTWVNSKRYERTRAKLAEIYRKRAAHRKSLHGQLVNYILSLGNEIKLEKLSYKALQKNFGKSVGVRAPGTFAEILKRKAVCAGVTVHEFPTRSTRLSQVCLCGQVKKKPLSQRWHICDCGITVQRDVSSAFLAACVEGERLNASLARELWATSAERCSQAALSVNQPANGRGNLPPASASAGDGAGRLECLAKGGVEPGGCNRQKKPAVVRTRKSPPSPRTHRL